ncbi:MAG TPA: glucodextranase DOMON-like domain-containing protein, partial [Burkholderiaceae bacterium]|nr:glucodextranase DOMON-like domain-containing protein [Burkholderiaceae bacterium]
ALAFGFSAHAVEFTDPRGDDKGPGSYTYPTDGVYKAGSFDLVKLKAEKSGANVDFSVDVAANLEDPWGMGGGFAVQMVFIFIKTGAPDARADTWTGLNMKFAPGSEWNKVVVLSPQKKARVTAEAESKLGALAKDIVVPNITRGRGRTITGSVPLSELGGDGNVDGWSYQVVMQSNEGFPAATDFLTRKVNEYEGQHRFGGGNDGDCDPHTMDVLDGPDARQADMLAHECAADGKATKPATLKMVKK